MTLSEATGGIGKRFKVMIPGVKTDIIRSVDADGYIHGDFTTAHHSDCRFIGEQPEHLKGPAIVGDGNTPETIKRLAGDTEQFDKFIEAAKEVADIYNYPAGTAVISHTFIPKQNNDGSEV